MASLSVRNLSDETDKKLQKLAEESFRSKESQVKYIIELYVNGQLSEKGSKAERELLDSLNELTHAVNFVIKNHA